MINQDNSKFFEYPSSVQSLIEKAAIAAMQALIQKESNPMFSPIPANSNLITTNDLATMIAKVSVTYAKALVAELETETLNFRDYYCFCCMGVVSADNGSCSNCGSSNIQKYKDLESTH